MTIRSVRQEDLKEIARIHKQAFIGRGLSGYSDRIVAKRYELFRDTCIFLLNEEDMINGFIVGGSAHDLAAARKRFFKENLALCLFEAVMRPRDLVGRLKGLVWPPRPVENFPAMQLLSIAVIGEARGTGLASRLLAAFEARLPANCTYALSVDSQNRRAIDFYVKHGFRLEAISHPSLVFAKVTRSGQTVMNGYLDGA